MNIKKIALAIALPAVLLLSACSVQAAPTTDNHASAAPAPAAKPSTTPSSDANSLIKGFGQIATYSDGVSVSVSVPGAYTPSDEAAGVVAGQTNVVFTIVVTNNSKDALSLDQTAQANSGGQQASAIFDLGANIGFQPSAAVLPGQTIQFQQAFSVADPNNITLQYAPTYDYKAAIFDSKH